uniref:Prostaglandin-H2 D-isomerase n=1 Tax=Varanus komodoensis TaxID=61221 RepID=A0A8D2IQM5_VARKO
INSCPAGSQPHTPVLFTQFSGGWYSIGLASDAPWFQEKKAVMKMSTVVVAPTGDGNLETNGPLAPNPTWLPTASLPEAGPPRCGAERPPGASLAQPSVSGRQDQCETRKSSFLRTEQSRQLRPELQEKFRQAALAEGLAPEDVLILPQTGMSRGGAL